MNARLAFPLLAGLVVATLALALVLPAFGQSGIQVTNADATRTTSTSLASDLNTALNGVSLRIVTESSNALRYSGLAAPPAALQSLLGQATSRVVFDHAASSRTALLSAIPGGLQSVLEQVALRVIYQYAAAARQQPLVYPKALIGMESRRLSARWLPRRRLGASGLLGRRTSGRTAPYSSVCSQGSIRNRPATRSTSKTMRCC
jgi:hypothetical protein